MSNIEKACYEQLAEKANKVQEAWITPTLINGWEVNDTSPQYFKDDFGIVHFRGSIKSGTAGTVPFNLPVGYRPSISLNLTLACQGNTVGRADITTSGAVVISSYTTWASLANMTFRAEQ